MLAGGRSSEHEISLASASAIRTGLEQAGHEPVAVAIDSDGRWTADGEPVAIEPSGGVLGADVVFPALHGPFGEDGTVQGLLELADVPYVGAGVLASALCMDKVTFKDVMAHAGIPQVAYRRARKGDDLRALEALGLPVFVKPARLGSSVGISKAGTAEELRAALEEAWRHDPLAIVEALSRGMEVECSVVGNDDPVASEPGELVVNADWYDYDAKYKPGGMDLVVPARLEDATRARVRELAVEVFKRVELRWPRPGRLLRRGRQPRARQRAEHDARLHRDQRVPEAVRGVGPGFPRPAVTPDRAGAGTSPARAGLPLLTTFAGSSLPRRRSARPPGAPLSRAGSS